MDPHVLAMVFVIGSVLAMWGINTIGDWLYPPAKSTSDS
jgi:hypothetical protein